MKSKLLLASLLFSTNALASDVFVEFNFGRASTDAPVLTESEFANNITRSVDDSDTGFSFNVGYQLNSHFSVSAGYVDLGEGEHVVSGDTITPEEFVSSVEQTPILANGFTASVIYHVYETEKLAFDIELGAFNWDSDIRSTSQLGVVRRNESGTDAYWGVSVGYKFTTQWHFVAGYQSFNLENNVDYPFVGVNYNF